MKSPESSSKNENAESEASANAKRRVLPGSLYLVAIVAVIAVVAVAALVIFNISTFSAKFTNMVATASGGQMNVPANIPSRLQTDLALFNNVSNIYVAYVMTLNIPQLSAYMGKDSRIIIYKLGNTTRTMMQLQLLGKTYMINYYRFKNLSVQCSAGTINMTPAAVCVVSNNSDIGSNPFSIAPIGYQNMTYVGKNKNLFGTCESFSNSIIVNTSGYQGGMPSNSSGNLTGVEESICVDSTYGYLYNMTSYTLSQGVSGAINKTALSSVQAFNVSIGNVTQADVTPPASFALGPYISCSNNSVAFDFTPIMEPLPSKITVTLVRYNQTLFGYDNVTLGNSSLPQGAKELSSYRISIGSRENMSGNSISICAGNSCEVTPC